MTKLVILSDHQTLQVVGLSTQSGCYRYHC